MSAFCHREQLVLKGHRSNVWSVDWAPDGASVLFLSSRGGTSQVWRIPIDGGEAGRGDQDIAGARANGLASVAVSWGFGSDGELEKAAPDYQASRFSELVALLTERR